MSSLEGKPSLPEGYEEISDDIVGYWEPKVHRVIHVIPQFAKMFDNKIDPKKPSILIFCKLVDSAILVQKDELRVEGKPGDLIGIWGKADLRKLMNVANRDVFIYENGSQDIGKPEPMILYSVNCKSKTGDRLELVEDRRDKSRGCETWWHKEGGEAKTNNGRTVETDDDFPL